MSGVHLSAGMWCFSHVVYCSSKAAASCAFTPVETEARMQSATNVARLQYWYKEMVMYTHAPTSLVLLGSKENVPDYCCSQCGSILVHGIEIEKLKKLPGLKIRCRPCGKEN